MCQNFVAPRVGAEDQAMCFFGSPYLEPALNGPQKLVRILTRVLLLKALHKFAPCPPRLGPIPGVKLICDSDDRIRSASAALGLGFCSSRWPCFPRLPGSPQPGKELLECCVIRHHRLARLVGQQDKALLTVADLAQQLNGIE